MVSFDQFTHTIYAFYWSLHICTPRIYPYTYKYVHIQYMRVQSKPTGWPRPIACLRSQVIFRKRATNHRALLRKITCKDQASYGSSPPCMGSLQFVGSLKSLVSFAEHRLFYMALLQKRPIILRSLLISLHELLRFAHVNRIAGFFVRI